ncbi:MAG TPA: pyridoxamine 5'-phosphate oxidase family protein [Dehalococcoidia bacterium]|nr:pyridoxamine 5'-phosphate oxidase family protein [Dehalococcoidia bacterium]
MDTIPIPQGDLALLQDPVAQSLLRSTIPARLAYAALDGTPRVVPIWFHWTGSVFVLGTPPRAPKLKALAQHPRVALTIDSAEPPYKVLSVRGTAAVEHLDEVTPEYAAAAQRYLGAEQGTGWVEQVRGMGLGMTRITIHPTWVGVLDFERRLPSALADRDGAHEAGRGVR